ncbi:ATP-binding protein [Corynebacterium riegelii]|uniref:AlbA family DNA-binding domain-containing protein n=1 Tax=Corynebacterium riegelii TaxID=156976 RepID=UPI00254A9C91|nr:ATP-binding protein [Corynebacterium riegelii]MDK7180966.1 ATP-binding protein [Corynebacterium riegelii]
MFTALHSTLGISPTDRFTNEMLDKLVEERTAECQNLDFKGKIDSTPTRTESDVRKDLCAMANSGGGVIVYGVEELPDMKDHAGKRINAGEYSSGLEQAYLSVATTHISPPLRGVEFHRVEHPDHEAFVVVVPASKQVPHMYFSEKKNATVLAAPTRNGTHSEWLSEPEIANLYRVRFQQEEVASHELEKVYSEVAARRTTDGFWGIGVAVPSYPVKNENVTEQDARVARFDAYDDPLRHDYKGSVSPATASSYRKGLKRWTFSGLQHGTQELRAYVELHENGAIAVLSRLDKVSFSTQDQGVSTHAFACLVGDLLALIRHYGGVTGNTDYTVRCNVEWDQERPMELWQPKHLDFFSEEPVPLKAFSPVEAEISAASGFPLIDTARTLVMDCLNQAGIEQLPVWRK